jgi:hypothetical protein
MATYVLRNGLLVDKHTGERMPLPADWKPAAPRIQPDMEPFISPVSGKVIGGRAQRRDDMKRHDCIDGRDIPRRPYVLSEKYAKLTGLPLKGRDC